MSAKHKPRAPVLKCRITQEIIDRAVPRDSTICLLAEAVKEAFPNATNVSADVQSIRVTDREKGLRYIWVTPRSAGVVLMNFEHEIRPAPLEFTLRKGQVINAGKKNKTLDPHGLSRTALRASTGGGLERVGGKAPPVGKGMGHLKRRRVFGMRAGPGLPSPDSPGTE